MGRRLTLTGVLAVHLGVAVVHGVSHGGLGVTLTASQNALVALTTFVGPLAGVLLARRDHRWGVPVFTVSMAAGLLLGVGLHFLLENPDHVRALPAGSWRVPFQLSAGGVALTQLGGAGFGAWRWASR